MEVIMTDEVMQEILDIARNAGMEIEPITTEDVAPILNVEGGDKCLRCGKWFPYDCIVGPGVYKVINSSKKYCSSLCKETHSH